MSSLILVSGYNQNQESKLFSEIRNSINLEKFDRVHKVTIDGSEKFDYESKISEIEEKLNHRSILIGHSTGASLCLKLRENSFVEKIIALDPLRKFEDDKGEELEISRLNKDKVVLIESGAKQIDLPNGVCKRKVFDTGHFFKNYEGELADFIKSVVHD